MSAKQFRARVQELGRVAIPKELQDTEGIHAGDFVDVTVKLVRKAAEVPAT